MPDPNEDDDSTTTKIAAKLKTVAKKPTTYGWTFFWSCVGFIAGAWLFM